MFRMNSNLERFFLCISCLLVVFMAGCTAGGSSSKGKVAPSVEASEGAEPSNTYNYSNTLDSINVVGKGDAVLLEASGEINFTSYKKTDPSRIIIDLPGVDISSINSPMVVDNSYIVQITLSQVDGVGKVEIELEGGIGHEIKAGEDSILVDLKRDLFVSGETGEEVVEVAEVGSEEVDEIEYNTDPFEDSESEGEPVFVEDDIAESEDVIEVAEVGSEAQIEAEAIEASILPSALKLLSLTTDVDRNGTVVRIKGDGMVSNYNSFGLDNPGRLVIDVWDVDSELKSKKYSVGGPHIEQIRVGKHSDKIRFVFDSSYAAVGNHKIKKDGEYLVVSFLEGDSEEEVSEFF